MLLGTYRRVLWRCVFLMSSYPCNQFMSHSGQGEHPGEAYRVTSLIRRSIPLGLYRRSIYVEPYGGPWGGGAPYERGTPEVTVGTPELCRYLRLLQGPKWVRVCMSEVPLHECWYFRRFCLLRTQASTACTHQSTVRTGVPCS